MSDITVTSGQDRKARNLHRVSIFSLRELAVFVALVVVASVLMAEHRRHLTTLAALSRYESTLIPTTLASGQFRIIGKTVVEREDTKVLRLRIESNTQLSTTLRGDHSGSSVKPLSLNSQSGGYSTEFWIVFDHLSNTNQLKFSTMGYSISQVPEDYSLESELVIHDVSGVYSISESVSAFVLNGEHFSLSLK